MVVNIDLFANIFETGTRRGTVQQAHVGPFRQTSNSAHYCEPRRSADRRSQSRGERHGAEFGIADGHRENISLPS